MMYRNPQNSTHTHTHTHTHTQVSNCRCFFAPIFPKLFLIFAILFPIVGNTDEISDIIRISGEIRELETEILHLDSQLRRCDRARGTWRTATIIGGIGVVGTATGAIIQSSQIRKAKNEQQQSEATE